MANGRPRIRRALIYSALTGALAVADAGTVVVLRSLFAVRSGPRQADLSVGLSALAITALFGPLPVQLQSALERGYYRQCYDAAKTPAAFGATATDQADVDPLAKRLMNVVEISGATTTHLAVVAPAAGH